MPVSDPDPIFFDSPAEWHEWLRRHHDHRDEVWVGFYRKAVDPHAMSWSASVDEALCWGWIDGLCRRIDEHRYTHRFTPRRPRSHWSATNLAKVEALQEAGRMQPPGLVAHARRVVDSRATSVVDATAPSRRNPPAKKK